MTTLNNEELTKRVKAIEDFFSISFDGNDPGWPHYTLTADTYSGEADGFLGRIIKFQKEIEDERRKERNKK